MVEGNLEAREIALFLKKMQAETQIGGIDFERRDTISFQNGEKDCLTGRDMQMPIGATEKNVLFILSLNLFEIV